MVTCSDHNIVIDEFCTSSMADLQHSRCWKQFITNNDFIRSTFTWIKNLHILKVEAKAIVSKLGWLMVNQM